MAKIKIGYAPTRRSIFSAPDAVKYRGLTADRLKELGIDFVDITDVMMRAFFMTRLAALRLQRNSKKRKSTDFSFHTAISELSLNAQDLQKS